MAKKATEGPAKTNGKALAPRAKTQIASRSSGTGIAGKGFEQLTREDLILPRLALLQPLSPEVVDQGQKAGTLHLTLSNRNFGPTVTITPILHFRSRVKWFPKDDGGGQDCASNDAKVPRDPNKYSATCAACEHSQWTKDKKGNDAGPACTLYENFICLINDEVEPVIIPMGVTKAKPARKFFSMAALKGGDMFDHQYKLGVVQEKNSKGQSYFNYTVSDIGKKTDEKKKAKCDQLWGSLQKANIVVEHEREDATEQTGDTLQPAAAGSKY
jgi:hypothetical protein